MGLVRLIANFGSQSAEPHLEDGSVYHARWWAYTYRIANFSLGGPNMRSLAWWTVCSTVFELMMLLQHVTAEGFETITSGLSRLDSKSIDGRS